jgi:Histidine kinase-, DNA gyrase B-, and HSP90-like ATPase
MNNRKKNPSNEDDEALAQKFRDLPEGESLTTDLAVDDRVIARVTDGIYREASSALRELISNAYDADATQVIIQTDAPRFDRIVIRDNGTGMSPEVIAYLVSHIGGSSKRTRKGKKLGTVNLSDVQKSPAGRNLIGKIGIGLFAVSQLTQHFQIITKRKGDNFRTSAVIVLKTHSEENLSAEDENAKFETGTVTVTRDPSADKDAHGTEIILMNLRKSTKDELGSINRWQNLEYDAREANEEELQFGYIGRPSFHIGRVDPDNRDTFLELPNLPWDNSDIPKKRFKKLYDAVANDLGNTISNPTTASVLDSYLKMIWDISLAVPIEYLEKHPFQTQANDGIELYQVANEKKGQAIQLKLNGDNTIADELGMESSSVDPAGGFKVVIDDIELQHPIKIDPTIRGNTKQDKPLLFVGKCITGFAGIPHTRGGGALEFEAYFYWNPIIVPKENNGVLIRINNASGSLFDETFLDYRVSELTRLKQIMAEVYVTKGLDPALNIDRESFNSSHPHYQYIKDWVHRSLRQVTNRLKTLNKEFLDAEKVKRVNRTNDKLTEHIEAVWMKLRGEDSSPPDIQVVLQVDLNAEAERRNGKLIIEHRVDLPPNTQPALRNGLISVQNTRVKALASVLSAYGLMDKMSYDQLQSLINDITKIYSLVE